jgi:hypothetical protein
MSCAKRLVLQMALPLQELNMQENAVSPPSIPQKSASGKLIIGGCGNNITNGGGPAPDGNAGCDMACKGNTVETCGGPNRLDVYQYTSSSPGSSPGKRGLAYNNNNPSANAEYANLFVGYSKISWGYDWGYLSWGLDSPFEL